MIEMPEQSPTQPIPPEAFRTSVAIPEPESVTANSIDQEVSETTQTDRRSTVTDPTDSASLPVTKIELGAGIVTMAAGITGFAVANVYVFKITQGKKDSQLENSLRQTIRREEHKQENASHSPQIGRLITGQKTELHTMVATTPQSLDFAANAERLGIFIGSIFVLPVLVGVGASYVHRFVRRQFR